MFLSPLKWPALALSLAMLLVVLVVVLSSNPILEETYLVPSIVGFLFFLTLFGLIANFKEVPRKIEQGDGFVVRIKIRLIRFWFIILGLMFVIAVGASALLAVKLLRIWINE